MAAIDDIIDDFSFIDDWEDRYRYVIELGRNLEPLPDSAHNDDNKVRGCASQVWLETSVRRDDDGQARLAFRGDSDAHIVRGLIFIIISYFSGRTPQDILSGDLLSVFEKLGLTEHLTPQRSNGVRAMVDRILNDARKALTNAD